MHSVLLFQKGKSDGSTAFWLCCVLFFIREPEKESPGGNTPPVSDTDRLVTADKEEKAEILHKL